MAMRWALAALLAVIAFPSVSAASNQNDVFTSNKNSNSSGVTPTWNLGQSVTITWNTDFQNVEVGYMNANDDEYVAVYTGSASTFKWTVNVNQSSGTDWSPTNVVYYLVAADSDNPDEYFYSNPVYIVQPGIAVPSSATTKTAPPTSMATAATTIIVTQTPTAPAAAKATTTNAAASDSADSSKLGSGTTAGIAVGAVAGAGALVAAIIFLLRNRRLKRQLENTEAITRSSYMPYDQLPPNAGGASGYGSPDMAKTAAGLGAAAAAAGGAAGHFAGKKNHPAFLENGRAMVMSELPTRSKTINRVSELPAEPFDFASPRLQSQDPVEIGGTELMRPTDEQMPHDSRPLMGEHARDTTD